MKDMTYLSLPTPDSLDAYRGTIQPIISENFRSEPTKKFVSYTNWTTRLDPSLPWNVEVRHFFASQDKRLSGVRVRFSGTLLVACGLCQFPKGQGRKEKRRHSSWNNRIESCSMSCLELYTGFELGYNMQTKTVTSIHARDSG